MSRGAKIIPASAAAAKGAAGGSRWGGETAPKILILLGIVWEEEEGTLAHPGGMKRTSGGGPRVGVSSSIYPISFNFKTRDQTTQL